MFEEETSKLLNQKIFEKFATYNSVILYLLLSYRQVEDQEIMRLSSHRLIEYDDGYNKDISQETDNYNQGKYYRNYDGNHCRQNF